MPVRSVDRLDIMYVAGLPRSGSTVLGLVLGEMPDAIFVGELSFFWRRFANGELCSCGQILPDCPFWSAVITEAFGKMTREHAREFHDLERSVLRRQWTLSLTPVRRTTRNAKNIGRMLGNRSLLYRSISKAADATCVIDSGKEMIFGSLMARLDDTNFNTIHIVRDPRGVAFSWQKQVKSDSEPHDMPRRSAGKTAAHWVLENIIMQVSLQALSRKYIRIRYEDLISQRESVTRKIEHAISPVASEARPAPQSPGSIREHHLVASNPGVRRNFSGSLRLRLDEEWRTLLPRGQKRLVTTVCAPLMAAYGYRLRQT